MLRPSSSANRQSPTLIEEHPAITGSVASIARARINPRFATLVESSNYKRLKTQVPLNDTLTNCLGVWRKISLRIAADDCVAAGNAGRHAYRHSDRHPYRHPYQGFGRAGRNCSPCIRASALLRACPMNVTIGTSAARPSRRREALAGAFAT